jgi:hypothetical protein
MCKCRAWIAKKIEEKMNNIMKSSMEIQLVKKRLVVSVIKMSNYFGTIEPFKKNSVH